MSENPYVDRLERLHGDEQLHEMKLMAEAINIISAKLSDAFYDTNEVDELMLMDRIFCASAALGGCCEDAKENNHAEKS